MLPFKSRSHFSRMSRLADLMAYDMERQFARAMRRQLEDMDRFSRSNRFRYRDPFDEFEESFRDRDPFEALENEISQTIENFEKMETPPKIRDDVCYKMTMHSEKDGNVKVKTMEKEPGAEWKVKTEEYKRGEKAIESEQPKTQAKIEGKSQEKVGEEK